MISFSGVLPLKAALLLNPTFPELCVRSVDTQVTEAALEDMLDSILGAWALIQRLHRLLLRQTNRKKLNYSLWCFGLFWSLVSSVTQTSHWWCWPHFTIIVYPFPDQHLRSQANSKCPTSVHSRVKKHSRLALPSNASESQTGGVDRRWAGGKQLNNFYFFILKISWWHHIHVTHKQVGNDLQTDNFLFEPL